jgi:hypothetical protein
VNVCPAIVSVPLLGGGGVLSLCGFTPTLNVTVPLPLPLNPDVIVTQPTLLAAVHGQPAVAVTDTLPVPPPFGKFWAVGAIE